ncbi:MAG TPA: hypothetical protein VMM79_02310 [Longimicrobiales bacterium]|nr:hypothetical protein [Longimicrobiales bacterium]
MRLWLRLLSVLVPAVSRANWLREWEAELVAESRRGGRPARMAAGALADAWVLWRGAGGSKGVGRRAVGITCVEDGR